MQIQFQVEISPQGILFQQTLSFYARGEIQNRQQIHVICAFSLGRKLP